MTAGGTLSFEPDFNLADCIMEWPRDVDNLLQLPSLQQNQVLEQHDSNSTAHYFDYIYWQRLVKVPSMNFWKYKSIYKLKLRNSLSLDFT